MNPNSNSNIAAILNIQCRKGDTFERHPIQVGRADYEFAEVTQGLRRGDVVSLVAPTVPAAAGRKAPGGAASPPAGR